MRGLIYKEMKLFFKSIDKKSIILAVAVIALLLAKTSVYSGLFATTMLAITISMQHVMSFASDENVNWKKYQLSLPVSSIGAVASKYIAVICTLCLSIVGSILFTAISGIIYSDFDIVLLGLSVSAAIIIPLLLTGICLPLTYWFGFRSAQTMGLFVIVPIWFLIKYFEDGPGFLAFPRTLGFYTTVACIGSIAIFILSLFVSIFGYRTKQTST